ncbi:MAG: Sporulation kinase, partial [Candidatus Parcubacteria bacterium]
MNPLNLSQVNQGVPSATDTAGVFSVADGIIFSIIFILICIIVWLSNREIKISRSRVHAGEKLLESERRTLEKRISERTSAYVQAEEQRLIELQRNAEFGKLSQGLFHDLISPLSSVSIYAQQLEKDSARAGNYSDKDKEMIQIVIESSRRMNSYMESIRRSLGSEKTLLENSNQNANKADLGKEIGVILDILGYKAQMSGVEIDLKFKIKDPVILAIHPVRLHQLILNLVSNAIDACTDFPVPQGKSSHQIIITVDRKTDSDLELSISDTGCGISEENQKRMFVQAFSTKKEGSGIGMVAIKTIVS